MLTANITVTGKTLDDIWYAMEEAYARMEEGNTTGHASNESGSFTFTLALAERPDTDSARSCGCGGTGVHGIDHKEN